MHAVTQLRIQYSVSTLLPMVLHRQPPRSARNDDQLEHRQSRSRSGVYGEVASWIAACKGIGVGQKLTWICWRTEDAEGGVAKRAQIMLSAISDCRRVSVFCCTHAVSGIPAVIYGNDENLKT